MKKVLIPLTVLILISCVSHKENNNVPQAGVPNALQGNKENRLTLFSKSGRDEHDLVEALYEEKVKSTPTLHSLEKMIDKLNGSQSDSLEIFNDFKSKNQQYYSSAKNHLNFIKDSLLKKEIENVIGKSILLFNNKISGLENLTTILNNKSGSADDRHSALMILISLGVMKEYQEKNMPSTKPIESVINNYNYLIQKMDSVISKNK